MLNHEHLGKWKSTGHYLIVKLETIEKEQKSDGGIILAKTTKDLKREQNGSTYAKVIHVGTNAWSCFTDKHGHSEPWAGEGDRVMLAKYAGQEFPFDDQLPKEIQEDLDLYRIIKDDDILAVEVNDE